MSDSKISCPHCGQHILADDAWRGQTVTCPACQRTFAVPDGTPGPQAHAAAPPPLSAPSPSVYPAQTSPPPASPANRTSGLAIASLVLSFFGCLAIGGVICGHLARKQIRRDPTLGGSGLALAGLIIGYVNIAVTIVVLLVAAAGFLTARNKATETRSRAWTSIPSNNPAPRTLSRPTPRPGQKPRPAAPAEAVSGQIKGQAFTYSAATLHQNMSMFAIREGEDFFADREVKIFLFAKPGESLENRTWSIKTTDTGLRPHVHLTWQENGNHRTEIVSSDYQLELKTGSMADGVLTGSLSLTVTGKTPAELKGNFAAVVE